MANKKYTNDFFYSRYLVSGSGIWRYLWIVISLGILSLIVIGITKFWLIGVLWLVYTIYLTAKLLHANQPKREGAVCISSVRQVNKQIYIASKTPLEKITERKALVNVPVDLKKYIENKANRNVMIVGTSGQGKSLLARYLLEQFDNRKVIFSFKPK